MLSRICNGSGVVAILIASAQVSGAYPRPGTSERVSVNASGMEGDLTSQMTAASADGRYIAFQSLATNLVPEDGNGESDIYLRDFVTGITERVSVSASGGESNGPSHFPALSADGRYVVFDSQATNLVAGDTSTIYDVFIRDRVARTTERVSIGPSGEEGNGNSRVPGPGGPQSKVISADGRYVVFQSQASNFAPGDTAIHDVFVRDRIAGTTERVSVGPAGEPANGVGSLFPSISTDGRYVVFHSFASNLVAGDTNGAADIFVRDLQNDANERVSVASDGTQANGASFYPVASGDGRYIVFHSDATNLVPGDTNAVRDVFLHDRQTGMTERISVSTFGAQANAQSIAPVISPDGRFVTFDSDASNLIPGDSAGLRDSFVRDRQTHTTERISLTAAGGETDHGVGGGAISDDGRYVAFYGGPSNVVPGGTNPNKWDVFVRHRGPALGIGRFDLVKVPAEIAVTGWATFSGAEIIAAVDPSDDGSPLGPTSAREAGAEIIGAAIIYRVEPEDLLFRMELASLPAGGGTAISYVFEFTVGGAAYEIQATRSGTPPAPPNEPAFGLFQCADICTPVQQLQGGFGGSSGREVVVSLPLGAAGVSEASALIAVRARTEGGVLADELVPLDDLPIPNTTVPISKVELGVASVSVPEQEVTYSIQTARSEGKFSSALSTIGLPAGERRLWARACLGTVCGPGTYVDENAAAELRISSITRTAEGNVALVGVSLPNSTLTVQRTSDLFLQFTDAASVAVDGNGAWEYTDSSAAGEASRFYRAKFP